MNGFVDSSCILCLVACNYQHGSGACVKRGGPGCSFEESYIYVYISIYMVYKKLLALRSVYFY